MRNTYKNIALISEIFGFTISLSFGFLIIKAK